MSGYYPDLPDFETLVVDRLYLIYHQIEGFKRREKREPVTAFGWNDVPAVYTLIGPMTNAIPADTAGSYVVTRTYIVRVLGRPLATTNDVKRGAGAKALADLLPFFARLRNYFLWHPLLEVGSPEDAGYLEALAYLRNQIRFQDSGEGDVAGPGGIPHLAMDLTLTLDMGAAVDGLA